MKNQFPKYNQNRQTAEKGVTFVKRIVEDQYGWIFRKIPLDDDFGLDGYIDILKDGEYVTGKYFGVQIKTGKSYFSISKGFGWEFKGETKHLNYYLNCQFPILIILVDLETQKAFWTELKFENISQAGENWKIEIFKTQELEKGSKEKLQNIAGNVIDYLPQLQYQWELNKLWMQSGVILLGIDRSEIESLNFTGFETLLEKLLSSHEMVLALRGKITFLIFGYDDDKRELYQISEVRNWIQKVIPIFKYWGYFLNMEDEIKFRAGLSVLHTCSVDVEITKFDNKRSGYHLEFNGEQSAKFMEQMFMWLNEICFKYNIEEDVTFEQSMKITQIVMNLPDEEINKIKTTYNNAYNDQSG
jgi:hypothetical protein